MTPSERVSYIKGIADALYDEDWSLVDLTLKSFGAPWTDSYNGHKRDYLFQMLGNSEDGPLLGLAKHFGLASELETVAEPTFWSSDSHRVFLSHLSTSKANAHKLKEEFARLGIVAFVAHDDIEPTREWQTEIETALVSMDCLIALLTPGFSESKWCDQEVGVAIGRKVLVIAVRLGVDPHGFIGKYQAVYGLGKPLNELARELAAILIVNPVTGPKVTNGAVRALRHSWSYDASKHITTLIEKSPFISDAHVELLREAVENNGQVKSSFGVPQRIIKIIAKASEWQA